MHMRCVHARIQRHNGQVDTGRISKKQETSAASPSSLPHWNPRTGYVEANIGDGRVATKADLNTLQKPCASCSPPIPVLLPPPTPGHLSSRTTFLLCGGQMCESRRHLLEQVLKREYALYRSHSYHRKMMGRVGGTAPAATTRGSVSPPAAKGQSWRGWMGIVPAWVWKELKKSQRDARQVGRTIGLIGSTHAQSFRNGELHRPLSLASVAWVRW